MSAPSPSRPLRLLLVTIAALGFLALGRLWTARPPDTAALVQSNGLPLGGDFVVFYATSQVVRGEDPASAYDLEALHARQQEIIGAKFGKAPWLYPPPALLVVLPLSLLPYLLAWGVWSSLGFAGLLGVTRKLSPGGLTTHWMVAFPGVLVNLATGQNGLFSAGVLGAGLLALPTRPVLAGGLLGLLSLKPQLLPAVLVALVAGGHRRALGGLVASALALALSSLAWLGTGPWKAFSGLASGSGRLIDSTELRRIRMPTTYCAARSLALDPSSSLMVQGLVSLATLVALAWIWRRPASPGIRRFALVLGIGLITPYVFDYDLALLAIGLAAVAPREDGPPALLVALLWALPLAHPLVLGGLGIPLGPPVMAAGLAWCVLQARAEGQGRGDSEASPAGSTTGQSSIR